MTSELYDVIGEAKIGIGDLKKGPVYGWPVIANSRGIIFAWTRGTYDVFLRLREDRKDAASRDGARSDPTYPHEWINFYLIRLGPEWREVLKRWIKVSYADSLIM